MYICMTLHKLDKNYYACNVYVHVYILFVYSSILLLHVSYNVLTVDRWSC